MLQTSIFFPSIKRLNEQGARKFVLSDVGQLGCISYIRARRSPGLGGVRIAGLSSSAGLQDYEDTIEDFVPCPDGTFLGVEGKLGDTDM